MSLCLGKGSRWGPGIWSPSPRTHALSNGMNFMSRPLKNEPRDQQLNLSLTVSELENIRKRAASLGLRPAHFGRALLLDAKKSHPSVMPARPDEANPLIRLIYNQLIRLGSNLNQMVRHLHRTGDPLPADLEPLLKDIRAILARLPQ